jgi:hypothetical protein
MPFAGIAVSPSPRLKTRPNWRKASEIMFAISRLFDDTVPAVKPKSQL